MNSPFKIFRKRAPEESVTDKVCRAMAAAKRLLLVEDDPAIVETIAALTDEYAMDLVAVDSVAAARHEVRHDGPFHAAILDVRLTNGDGVTLYREIVETVPELKVVFMTGYDNPVLRATVESIGPARVYSKVAVMRPKFFEQLLAEVGITRRCLDPGKA